MKRIDVKSEAVHPLATHGRVTSGQLAAEAGVSRQTAHAVLSRLVAERVAEAAEAGRGAHYVSVGSRSFRWDVRGLEEHWVWSDLDEESILGDLQGSARSVLQYAVSEMVNNVIDHSGSNTLTVRVGVLDDDLTVSIEDVGIGALEKIREAKDFESHFDALGQLPKGKLTTDPERHTGDGIFFTSKVVDRFILAANGIEWTVDNVKGDVAVGVPRTMRGTTIGLTHATTSHRTIESVFEAYTTGFDFDTTRTVVKLFEHGDTFVSRSEARRITEGLEQFRIVVVDFTGIDRVGQGFVDELFRVWASGHGAVTLEPVNMNPAVEFMVHRGLPHTDSR